MDQALTDHGSTARAAADLRARAIDALIAALTEGDSAAARALSHARDERAVQPLMAALEEEGVREEAARALGKLGDPRAVKRLRGLLRDRSEQVREAAAEALGRIGDRSVVDPLLEALVRDKPDPQADLAGSITSRLVRAHAAEALGRIGDRRAIEPLLAELDGAQMDRAAAAEALGRILAA